MAEHQQRVARRFLIQLTSHVHSLKCTICKNNIQWQCQDFPNQSKTETKDKIAKFSPIIICLSMHPVNKYTGNVQILSNPVYSLK